MSVADPAARLRGTAAGLLTAALAVAAHAAGGGAPPTGAGRRAAGSAGGDGRCTRRDHRPRSRRPSPARPARRRPAVRPPNPQRRRAQPRVDDSTARRGDAGRACGCGRRRRASDRRERSAVPSRVTRGARRGSDRRRAGRRRTRCGDRRGRSAAAFGTSACRFGVAPGSAGQPLPLTDIPTTQESHNRMRFITRASSRALITVAATGAAMSIGLLAGAAPAWAHVHVDADNPTPGSYSVLTFRRPERIRERRPHNAIERRPAQRGVGEHGSDAGLDCPAGS